MKTLIDGKGNTGVPYFRAFVILMFLTVATVGVAFVDLGVLNIVTAVTIAAVKAVIVAVYFMHLRDNEPILWVVGGAGVVWFILLVALTLSDFLSRGWLYLPDGW